MAFHDDGRGQSVVIGSLLIFTILVLAFSGYQAFVVPSENADVEVDHFQDTEDGFSELRSNIVNAVGTDSSRSTSFRLGVRYPTRAIALNPPPAAGRLETTDRGDVDFATSQNVCSPDGTTPTTRSLVYTPGYNEYAESRAIGYESRLLSREFRSGSVYDQRLVRSSSGNDQISLYLLTGEVSENGVGSYTLEVNGSSQYSTTITNPTITIPSRFNATQWEDEILADRSDITATNDGDRIKLDFDGGDYTVSCAVVGLDSDPAFTPLETDDGSGGSSDGGGESEVGQGGTEEWDSGNTTRTLSTEGGLWTDIGTVNSVVLSDPRVTPIVPENGEAKSDERYFRAAVTIGDPPDGDKRYVLVLPDSKNGMMFKDNDDDGDTEFDGNPTVKLLVENVSASTGLQSVFSSDLDVDVINAWYEDGQDLNLLNASNYQTPQDIKDDLADVREYLENNNGQEAFITEVHGRVNLTIDDRYGSLRAASAEDLQATDIEQELTFTLDHDLDSGEEVTIDLSDPQAPNQVDYRGSPQPVTDSVGSATFTVQNNQDAEITYTAAGSETEGQTVTITVIGIDADNSQATGTYDVVFEGPDLDTQEDTFDVN